MKNKFDLTPGNWVHDGLEIRSQETGQVVARVVMTLDDQDLANSSAIAALKELKQAVETIASNLSEVPCSHPSHYFGIEDEDYDSHSDLCLLVGVALAKARGET